MSDGYSKDSIWNSAPSFPCHSLSTAVSFSLIIVKVVFPRNSHPVLFNDIILAPIHYSRQLEPPRHWYAADAQSRPQLLISSSVVSRMVTNQKYSKPNHPSWKLSRIADGRLSFIAIQGLGLVLFHTTHGFGSKFLSRVGDLVIDADLVCSEAAGRMLGLTDPLTSVRWLLKQRGFETSYHVASHILELRLTVTSLISEEQRWKQVCAHVESNYSTFFIHIDQTRKSVRLFLNTHSFLLRVLTGVSATLVFLASDHKSLGDE